MGALTAHAARAETTDAAAAEALVVPMSKAPPAAVTADAVARATEALEQATRFRAAGDEAHAKAADGLALEWAETARDLVRAADAEKQAEDRKRQAMVAQAQLSGRAPCRGRHRPARTARRRARRAAEDADRGRGPRRQKPPVAKDCASASLLKAPVPGGSTPARAAIFAVHPRRRRRPALAGCGATPMRVA